MTNNRLGEQIEIVAMRDVPRGYLFGDEVERPDEIAIKAGTIFAAVDYGELSGEDPRHEFVIEFEKNERTVLSDYFATNTETCKYGLPDLPEGIVLLHEVNRTDESVPKWTGTYPIPHIGDRVNVLVNSLGVGTIQSYFQERGYVGVIVKLENEPPWHREACEGTWHAGLALVLGAEIERRLTVTGQSHYAVQPRKCGETVLG